MLRRLTTAPSKVLFQPAGHLWVRMTRDHAQRSGLVPPRSAWQLHIGVTERGMEDIGSIIGLTQLAAPGTCVRVGDPLLRVDWEAHKISDGDELYHTTWENVEGHFTVKAPVAGSLVSLHERAAVAPPNETVDGLDETAWLAILHVDRPALQSAPGLVSAEAYREHCRAVGPGTFGSEALYGSEGV